MCKCERERIGGCIKREREREREGGREGGRDRVKWYASEKRLENFGGMSQLDFECEAFLLSPSFSFIRSLFLFRSISSLVFLFRRCFA